MEKTLDELKKELLDRLNRSKLIVEGLENNEAFKELINDFKSSAKRLDDSWQWISDEKVLKEAQITKMATLCVINSISNYKHDIEKAAQELDKLNHPDKVMGDFDAE